MRISLAQLNYHIGNFEENSRKTIAAIEKAKAEGADLVVFSELSVCGYPPQDLLEHKQFIELCQQEVKTIAKACRGIAAIAGGPTLNPNSSGKLLYNTAFFLEEGKVKQEVHKTLLPTYDIFDEYRYFEPNTRFEIVRYKGKRIALTVCEDIWDEQPFDSDFSRSRLYTRSPMQELMKQDPELIINIAASPFSYKRLQAKENIFRDNARRYGLPVINVNQCGANTELIFEGGSLVCNPKGEVLHRLPLFQEEVRTICSKELLAKPQVPQEAPSGPALMEEALVRGVKDYFAKLKMKSAVLGLSGGIDSAVTLVIASKALGPGNVTALLMPSPYSSEHSVKDAEKLAKNLGVAWHLLPIHTPFENIKELMSTLFKGRPEDITEENIQSRIRGVMLMALANKTAAILLNTSNKSEAAVGYGTLYGDMAGGLSVLGDVYKTQVYELARYINRDKEVIPENTLIKPPSAELKPDQQDTDSLPEYEMLDTILTQYIEHRRSLREMTESGLPEEMVQKVIALINNTEYKRYQTPPILRISSKAFGPGRRMPLVAIYPGQ